MKQGWKYGILDDAVKKGSSNISLNKIKDEVGNYPVYGAKGFAKNVSFFGQRKEYLAIIKDGAGIGRVSKHPKMSSVLATLQYIIPKDGFDIDFIKYFLNQVDFKKHRNGSTIPHIYFKDYKTEPFPLLPLSEQKRIVGILDKAFAAIDQGKTNAQKNLQNSRELFESYLNKVFAPSAKLGAGAGEDWEEKKLGNITSKIGSGATPRGGKKSYKTEGVSLIRSLNVYDREFRKKNLAFINEEQAKKLSNVNLFDGDVLLNITGASVARCCVVPSEYLPARVNQHVSIIRLKNDIISSKLLSYLLTSKVYKDKLLQTGEKGGATRQAITKAQIEDFKILFPINKSVQQKTANVIDGLLSESKKLETIYQQKLADLEELKKSILQKAFDGQL